MKKQFNYLSISSTIRNILPDSLLIDRLEGAIMASLNKFEAIKQSVKTGKMSLKSNYSQVSETETIQYRGQRDVAVEFVSFCDDIAKIEKTHGYITLEKLPANYQVWLDKFDSVKIEEKKQAELVKQAEEGKKAIEETKKQEEGKKASAKK